MSIDSIGRGGPPGGVGSIADALPASGAAEIGGALPSGGVAGSEALGQLQRGELSLSQYLDVTVQQAVQHLEGKLPNEQLSFVQSELRRQLESDPILQELVRRTTGQLPNAGDE
jgi:hypothetical protein